MQGETESTAASEAKRPARLEPRLIGERRFLPLFERNVSHVTPRNIPVWLIIPSKSLGLLLGRHYRKGPELCQRKKGNPRQHQRRSRPTRPPYPFRCPRLFRPVRPPWQSRANLTRRPNPVNAARSRTEPHCEQLRRPRGASLCFFGFRVALCTQRNPLRVFCCLGTVSRLGIEPRTLGLKGRCSTD